MVVERDGAWRMLQDPATDAAALAEIAGAYPEFAEAVGKHPNAYPELIAWSRSFVPARATSPSQPVLSQPVPARTGRRVLWIVVLVVVLAAPVIPAIKTVLGASAGYGFGVVVLSWVAYALPGVAMALLGGIAAPTAGRTVGVVALGIVAAGAELLPVWLILTMDYQPVIYAALSTLAGVALFLAWAVGRPLRGPAYTFLIVVVAIQIGLFFVATGLTRTVYSFLADVGAAVDTAVLAISLGAVVMLVLETIAVVGVVVLAWAVSRAVERRAAHG